MKPRTLFALAVPAVCLTSCTRNLSLLDSPSAIALTTTGPWASMIYLARTDSGVIAVDLGWVGAEREIQRGLARLHATTADVRYVFITHAHRDHVAGWPLVRGARFYLGAREVPYFLGDSAYRSALPRAGETIAREAHPKRGELLLVPISGDSNIALGRDTMVALSVPGHTPGSMAYLFRGVLFAGDAVNWRPWTGFRGTREEFSEDAATSRASLTALWARIDVDKVRVVCSAHAKCGPADGAMRTTTTR